VTLTNGQTYFFILCVTSIVLYILKWFFTIYRIREINGANPCKKLLELQDDVDDLRRLFLVMHKKVCTMNTKREK